MSKLYCATCKYYDFNTCEGVDWCRLNNEETGICGNCEREFEDLDEATEHYNTVVEEENKLYSLNCEMASKDEDLKDDCPLKPLSDRLAEERKKVVQEIKDKISDGLYQNSYGETFIDGDIYEILDQIENGDNL